MPRIRQLLVEAEIEVNAARQNLGEVTIAWESVLVKLHPAALLIAAALRRLDRAHALLRSARVGTDGDQAA